MCLLNEIFKTGNWGVTGGVSKEEGIGKRGEER